MRLSEIEQADDMAIGQDDATVRRDNGAASEKALMVVGRDAIFRPGDERREHHRGGGNVVKFTDNGFEPSTLTINSGDTVKFENESGDDFWPASNVHPTHLLYPGFDAKKPVLPGDSYSFTFEKKGTWGYHNHLTPDVTGTIVVK